MEVEKEFESSLPKNTKAKEQSEASFSFNYRKTNRFKSYFRETFFFFTDYCWCYFAVKKADD